MSQIFWNSEMLCELAGEVLLNRDCAAFSGGVNCGFRSRYGMDFAALLDLVNELPIALPEISGLVGKKIRRRVFIWVADCDLSILSVPWIWW